MNSLALVALGINAIVVLSLTAFFAFSGKIFGPKTKHEGDAELAYETGLPPLSPAHEKMTVLYYRFAVLFVVFDVDLAFLLPWALNRQTIDQTMMLSVSFFLGLILLMLAYFWRKGALECR